MSQTRNSSLSSEASMASVDLFWRPLHPQKMHAAIDFSASPPPPPPVEVFVEAAAAALVCKGQGLALEHATGDRYGYDDDDNDDADPDTCTLEGTPRAVKSDAPSFDNYSFHTTDESEDTLHELTPSPVSSGTGSSSNACTTVPDPLAVDDVPTFSRRSESDWTPRTRREIRNINLGLTAPGISRSASIPTLPSHGTTTASSTTTATTTTTPPLSRRRLSRKQPPRLTESLELLSVMSSATVSPVSAHTALPGDTPRVSMSSGTQRFTLEIDRPPSEDNSTASGRDMSPVEYRKPSKSMFRRKSSLPPLAPSTVEHERPDMPTTPRYSLFANSVAHRALASSHRSIESRPPSTPGLSCSGTATESTCGTWDMDERERERDGESPGKKGRETRKARKARRKAESERFDATTPPTRRELVEASNIEVADERGQRVRFGDLIKGRRTIVVFLRHWFCSMCAQYMASIVKEVRRDSLDEAGVELIIIGNGSAKMIDGYAYKYFKSPFSTYTDTSLQLYRALGLTRQTTDAGADEDKGAYLVESVMEQTVSTLKRATKMPLRNPGHFTQLGGEFIFDGPFNVVYTHRMVNTRDHAPIRDVCAEAGVRLRYIHYDSDTLTAASTCAMESRPALLDNRRFEVATPTRSVVGENGTVVVVREDDAEEEDLDDWQAQRERTLEKIRMLRAGRVDGEEVEEFGYLAHARLVV